MSCALLGPCCNSVNLKSTFTLMKIPDIYRSCLFHVLNVHEDQHLQENSEINDMHMRFAFFDIPSNSYTSPFSLW